MSHKERTVLIAGPVRVTLVDGELRHLRVGEVEVIRRVYVAVRDRTWRTIPARLSDLRLERGTDKFCVTFMAAHIEAEIDFCWTGRISGEPGGGVTFTMDGEARGDFWRNRIGFCVLHPPGCAGQPCRVEHTDGTIEAGYFPQFIAPHQPFKDLRAIWHEVKPGLTAEVRLTGEVFEMEDQRNWTDGSFKIYGTPLDLPLPVAVREGERISQTFTFRLQGELDDEPEGTVQGGPVVLSVDETRASHLPRIGLGSASHGEPLTTQEISRLRALNLSHLRVDLELRRSDFGLTLAAAAREANALGVKLEVAAFVSNSARQELQRLKQAAVEHKNCIARWLIFHSDEQVTSSEWVGAARAVLGRDFPSSEFITGTNHYFTELNRNRPTPELLKLADGICYSINPQVHTTDEEALVESLEIQAATVESARQFTGGLPLLITPITLKPRFNPHSAQVEGTDQFGSLPAAVDVRQPSLFAAAWTLGSLKYLAESGTSSLTYYETTGWRGVMERESGSPLPEQFPTQPGWVFPIYHVLADVGEFVDGEVLPVTTSDALQAIGLALRLGRKSCLLLANLTSESIPLIVEITSVVRGIRRLNSSTFATALSVPEWFRARQINLVACSEDSIRLELEGYEIARVDF